MSMGAIAAQKAFVAVVGIDLAPAGGYALDQAVRVLRGIPNGELHVVHVIDEGTSEAKVNETTGQLRLYIREKLESLGGLAGRSVGVHVRVGRAAAQILQLARDVTADLIVLGATKAPHLKNLFVGSTTEHIYGGAECPVMVAGPKAPDAGKPSPVIEPACTDCVRERLATRGKTWSCERHSHVHARGHAYSYQREWPFAEHDSEVTPTGIDFKN